MNISKYTIEREPDGAKSAWYWVVKWNGVIGENIKSFRSKAEAQYYINKQVK